MAHINDAVAMVPGRIKRELPGRERETKKKKNTHTSECTNKDKRWER